MNIKILYRKLSDKSYALKYIYLYVCILLVVILAYATKMPWFGLSMVAMAISLLICGAAPLKSIDEFRQDIIKSNNKLKIFVIEHTFSLFVVILPIMFKIIFY